MAGGSAVHFYVPAAAPAVKCGSEGMKTDFPPKMAAGEWEQVYRGTYIDLRWAASELRPAAASI